MNKTPFQALAITTQSSMILHAPRTLTNLLGLSPVMCMCMQGKAGR